MYFSVIKRNNMSTERTTTQKVKLITGLIILGLAVTIILQNLEAIEVNLLFWNVNISLFILTSANLAIGFILGWFFISRKHKKQRQKEAITAAEK